MKKILFGIGGLFLLLMSAISIGAASSLSDPVDADAEKFFFKDQVVIPDDENAYFAFLGLFAPEEVKDIHAYGLKQWNDYARKLESADEHDEKYSDYPMAEFTIMTTVDDGLAIGQLEVDYYSCIEKGEMDCIDSKAINKFLEQNKLILSRLDQLYRFKKFQQVFMGQRTQEIITIAKLQSIQSLKLMSQGDLEEAFQLLFKNLYFYQDLLANGMGMVNLAILKVVRGIYWRRMAFLVRDYPEFAITKYSELRKLFGSGLSVPYAEIAKHEFYFMNKAVCNNKQRIARPDVNCLGNIKKTFAKPNMILSEFFNASQELIKLSTVHPAQVERESKRLYSKYAANSEANNKGKAVDEIMFRRVFDPYSMLRFGGLIYNVKLGAARGASLLAYLELYKNQVKPEEVNGFIKNNPEKFYDPLSRKQFVYDEKEGLLMMHEDGFSAESIDARIPNALKYR